MKTNNEKHATDNSFCARQRNSFNNQELLMCGRGELFAPSGPKLPLPPMLMFDKISHISDQGGEFNRGKIVAELAIKPDMWFFQCHFKDDPVMPGCLGLDAMWQLVGFYLGWLGGQGYGRALGSKLTKFSAQILPQVKSIIYHIDIKRVVRLDLQIAIANGRLECDNRTVYSVEDLRVGLFK